MSAAPLHRVDLQQGAVEYRDSGSGPVLLFVHGLLVNGTLWRKVIAPLEGEFRCIAPDLPLGSHRVPMRAGADLTPHGLARLISDFMDALELEDVTLVGNDTGGALCQLVATRHPERLARLVLTPCDAYENFLPPAFRPLQWIARVPGGVTAMVQPMRLDVLQRSPLAFGLLTKRPIESSVREGWVRPAIGSPEIRRDVTKVLKGIAPHYTLTAAERLGDFDRPTLLAWAPEDKFFKFSYAERLAAAIPDARLERIEDSGTFVSEDQPERVAELIADFAREPAYAASASAATSRDAK
ncbi:MAG: alpha/beta fold hydrolase [Solirubrobacteraceae bacterium]